MKGYNLPYKAPEAKTEPCTVICKNCNNTWTEDVTHYGSFAGYARSYDYCDKCKDEVEAGKFRNFGSLVASYTPKDDKP